MNRLYTLDPATRASLRAAGGQATSAVQVPAISTLDTRGSVATTTLLAYQNEMTKADPVAWWWLGDPTEFLDVYGAGPLAFDMREYFRFFFSLFAPGAAPPPRHLGVYAGTPVRNTVHLGSDVPPTVLLLGPQVRQRPTENIRTGFVTEPALSAVFAWPIEVIAIGLGGAAYVQFPDDGSLTFGPADDFAVEGWVTTAVANCPLLAKADTGRWPYALDVVAGKIRASRSDGTHLPAVTSTVTVNNSTWRYWLFSKSGSTLTLTVDETPVTASDSTSGARGATANSAPVIIGAGAFSGGVSNFAVYNRAVGTAEAIRHRRAMLGIGVEV